VFGRTWRVARIGGIDVRIDSSLIIVAALIGFSEYTNYTDFANHVQHGTAVWLAVAGTALFFLSILLHELAHAGMATARGLPVSGITLYMLGGATSVALEDKGPADEFLTTVVGPGTSFALAGVFYLLSHSLHRPLSIVFADLAFVNLFLAVFNLIPGFPLDGGRLLRAIVWRVTGNIDRATQIAGTVGMVFGAGLVAFGVWATLTTGWIFSLWSALIGWFLFSTARTSIRQIRLRRVLADAVVREAMAAPPRTVPADMTLISALDDYLRGNEGQGFPVVEDGDRVIGVLTMASASEVGQDEPFRPVRDAMVPMPDVMTVRAEEPLKEVLPQLTGRAALVLSDDGRLVGAIQPADVNRWLAAHR